VRILRDSYTLRR